MDERYEMLGLLDEDRFDDYYYEALFDWLASGLDPAEFYND